MAESSCQKGPVGSISAMTEGSLALRPCPMASGVELAIMGQLRTLPCEPSTLAVLPDVGD